MIGRRKDRGVALITAMLITALATLLAANLAWDNALDVRRTMVLLHRDQAIQVALGAESWVIGILHQDLDCSMQSGLTSVSPASPETGSTMTSTLRSPMAPRIQFTRA
jgi:type II secretory pathway component PulK